MPGQPPGGPHERELVEADVELHRMRTRPSKFLCHQGRGPHGAGEDAGLEARRVLLDLLDHGVGEALRPVGPAPLYVERRRRAGEVDRVLAGGGQAVVVDAGGEAVRRRWVGQAASLGREETAAELLEGVDVGLQPVPIPRTGIRVRGELVGGQVHDELDGIAAVGRGQLTAVAAGQRRVEQLQQRGLHVDGGDDRCGFDPRPVLELDGTGAAVARVDSTDW